MTVACHPRAAILIDRRDPARVRPHRRLWASSDGSPSHAFDTCRAEHDSSTPATTSSCPDSSTRTSTSTSRAARNGKASQSATRAAAAGGVTTLVDMPLNSIPATTTLAALEAKREAARGTIAVNVGFIGGVVPGNAGELAALHAAGVRLFKCFLVPSGVDEFPSVTEADLREALPILASLDATLLVHAELPEHIVRRTAGRSATLRDLPRLAPGLGGDRGGGARHSSRRRVQCARAHRAPVVGASRAAACAQASAACASRARRVRTISRSRPRRSPTARRSSSARRRFAMLQRATRSGARSLTARSTWSSPTTRPVRRR